MRVLGNYRCLRLAGRNAVSAALPLLAGIRPPRFESQLWVSFGLSFALVAVATAVILRMFLDVGRVTYQRIACVEESLRALEIHTNSPGTLRGAVLEREMAMLNPPELKIA